MPSLTSGIYMHYMVQTCKRVTPSQYSTRELFIYQDAVGLGNLFAISCHMNKILLGVCWQQKLSTHMKLNEKLTQGNHLEKICTSYCLRKFNWERAYQNEMVMDWHWWSDAVSFHLMIDNDLFHKKLQKFKEFKGL